MKWWDVLLVIFVESLVLFSTFCSSSSDDGSVEHISARVAIEDLHINDFSGEQHNFLVAIVRVSVKRPLNVDENLRVFRVQRSASSGDILDDDSSYPEDLEGSGVGLTRVECHNSNHSVHFASYHPVPSHTLYVLDGERYDDFEGKVLVSLFGRTGEKDWLSFAMVLERRVNHNETRIVLARDKVESCVLHFLPPPLQEYQPTGTYVTADGTVVQGQVSLVPASASFEVNAVNPISMRSWNSRAPSNPPRQTPPLHVSSSLKPVPIASPASSSNVVKNVTSVFGNITLRAVTNTAEQRSKPRPIAANGQSDDFMRSSAFEAPGMIPAHHSPVEDFYPLPVTALVQMPEFKSLVKPIMEGLIMPMIEPVAGILNTVLGFALSADLGQHLEAGLGDTVPLELWREIEFPLNRQIVPAMVEVVTDQLPNSVAISLKEYVVETVTERITDDMTERLERTVSPLIRDQVNDKGPKNLDEDITRVLGHILTRGLSHTIAPALVHVLSHTTLTDYYCWYCFYKQTYCDYCQFSPMQYYWTMWYAGYYSSYYADYYAEFFAKSLEFMEMGEGGEAKERFVQQSLATDPVTGRQQELVVEPVTDENFPTKPQEY